MEDNEFKCAVCGEVFGKGVSDEEAMQETQEIFGDYKKEDCDVVCDDCWNEMNIEDNQIQDRLIDTNENNVEKDTYGMPLPTEDEKQYLSQIVKDFVNCKNKARQRELKYLAFTKISNIMDKYYEPIEIERKRREIEQYADIKDIKLDIF